MRALQGERQIRVLLMMAGEQDNVLLQGTLMEWRGAAEAGRKDRQAEAERLELRSELRQSRERQKESLSRAIAAWGSDQAAVAQGSVFVAWRDLVADAAQLRRHAAKVFRVMCEGNAEVTLRAVMQSWADWRREAKSQRARDLLRERQMGVLLR